MAEDVQEFIQQQKLDKCVLIGHSMYVILMHPSVRVGTIPKSLALFIP
jgi:pimeloyl-ACP methyl ester carboxylesterase